MSATANDQSALAHFAPVHYQHSGKAPIAAIITSLGAGLAVGMVLAVVYAYLDLYIPIIGIVSVLLLFGLVVCTGGLLARMFKWGQLRSVKIAMLISLGVAVAAFYASWVAWEYAILHRQLSGELSMLQLFLHPWIVANIAALLNQSGVWSIGHDNTEPVKGIFLTVVWAIEAAFILIGIPTVAMKRLKAMSFCEPCQQWCQTRVGVSHFAATADPDTVKQRVLAGDLESIAQHDVAAPGTPRHYRLDLSKCPSCEASHLLTVNDVTIGRDRKGNQTTTVKLIVDRMYITAEWAAWISETARIRRESPVMDTNSLQSNPNDAHAAGSSNTESESTQPLA